MSSEIELYNNYIKILYVDNNVIFNEISNAVIEKSNEKIDEKYKKYNENNEKINTAIQAILKIVNSHFPQGKNSLEKMMI